MYIPDPTEILKSQIEDMIDRYEWTHKPPNKPGFYFMRDEDGGPTLYECIEHKGILKAGPVHGRVKLELEAFCPDATEWLESGNGEEGYCCIRIDGIEYSVKTEVALLFAKISYENLRLKCDNEIKEKYGSAISELKKLSCEFSHGPNDRSWEDMSDSVKLFLRSVGEGGI